MIDEKKLIANIKNRWNDDDFVPAGSFLEMVESQSLLNGKKKPETLANDILDFVNAFGFDADTFAETICHGHKTLQQSAMRLFVTTIRKMAEVTPDSRNEATVELAKKITEIANSYSLPLI